MTSLNDNLSKKQSKDNETPTISALQNKMYDYSIDTGEVITLARLLKESMECGVSFHSEEVFNCLSILLRLLSWLDLKHAELIDIVSEIRREEALSHAKSRSH